MWEAIKTRWKTGRWPWDIAAPAAVEAPKGVQSGALSLAAMSTEIDAARPTFPLQPVQLLPGVVPAGVKLAQDSAPCFNSAFMGAGCNFVGFPGYPYLADLATRAEYRAFADTYSTEITREWITLNSSETADDASKVRVTELTQRLRKIGLQNVIQTAAAQDSFFGRGQIFIDIKGHDPRLPLVISPKTIARKSFRGVKAVEAMWTTPNAYNASDPSKPDFYKPNKWWMLGREVHASRLITIITRPMPDMLKPAFNFGGISMSQLAEPYVNNWLRTRQSVSDLINNFSITALATEMGQVLQGNDMGQGLLSRAKLFTIHRNNQGLMLLDKEREELVQQNTPLASLDKLQAQAQEHMCAVSRTPAVILTGLSPTGLNASSEGEIRVFYDWIAAQQEAFWREVIEIILKILQLDMYGEIDEEISFTFNPLYQMTAKELAEIRNNNAQAAAAYIDRGVIAPQEQREVLARDESSGYQGLDIDAEIALPEGEEDDEDDDTQGSLFSDGADSNRSSDNT